MASYRHAQELAPELMKYVPQPVKPKFDTYEFERQPLQIDPMDTAQKMAKAVGHFAKEALDKAAHGIIRVARKSTMDAARLAVTGGTTPTPTSQAFLFNAFSTTPEPTTTTHNDGIGPGGDD